MHLPSCSLASRSSPRFTSICTRRMLNAVNAPAVHPAVHPPQPMQSLLLGTSRARYSAISFGFVS